MSRTRRRHAAGVRALDAWARRRGLTVWRPTSPRVPRLRRVAQIKRWADEFGPYLTRRKVRESGRRG